MTEKNNTNTHNWTMAQEGEKRFWENIVQNKRYLDAHASDFKKEIPVLLVQLRDAGIEVGNNSTVLQIGCALFDLIDFFPAAKKYAIEPLEDYFSTLHDIHRDIAVNRVAGKAEKLPYENASMDLIISHNMLDHVESPAIVLQEMRRVIKENGRIWIQVHTFTTLSLYIKKMLLYLKIDTKHLYFWTANDLLQEYAHHGFEPISYYTTPDTKPFFDCLKAGEWRPLVKKLLFIAPNRMTSILKPK